MEFTIEILEKLKSKYYEASFLVGAYDKNKSQEVENAECDLCIKISHDIGKIIGFLKSIETRLKA